MCGTYLESLVLFTEDVKSREKVKNAGMSIFPANQLWQNALLHLWGVFPFHTIPPPSNCDLEELKESKERSWAFPLSFLKLGLQNLIYGCPNFVKLANKTNFMMEHLIY